MDGPCVAVAWHQAGDPLMLVGLIDPSHLERKRDKPGRPPRWMTLDELQHASLTRPPKWSPWTHEMVEAALGEHQERGDNISTTLLTAACPRGSILERKADWIGSLDAMYASLRGTMIHRALEYVTRPGAVAEARFSGTLYVPGRGDVRVSGAPDLVTGGDEATLYDYKTTESPPMYDYPWRHHTEQAQFNRWLVNNAEAWKWQDVENGDLPWNPRTLVIRHLVVVYLGPKWPKPLEIQHSVPWTTPGGKTVKRKVPDIWPDAAVVKEFTPKAQALVDGLAAYPDFPKGAEKVWGGDASWRCPGPPFCQLPNCLAKRYPDNLTWDQPVD